MLTLTAVLSAHLVPLLWYLSINHSNPTAIKPPLLTGVLLQQAASQAAATAPQTPTQAKPPEQEKQQMPPQQQPSPPQHKVKPVSVKANEPAKAATKPLTQPVPSATAASHQVAAVTKTEAVAQSAGAAIDNAAASAVPVSAPLVNASAHFNAPPHYPQLSRKLREQGTVVLELTVLASGKVADVRVQQSSGYARLDKAALLAVKHWRYQPAQRAGKAIDYRYRQRLEFSLTEGVKP
ncbi:MAG: energy transducer TonB [Gammaproteobacteria bacterium]|nr:energy transducer TonB [Gammaproteobacteria bacterium]MBU1554524.1 energy transducer TonB [Gammaproteobacteria bacterium]MBU2071028.1 energy transducer TonB [Gammaproteobacteria bacterium]MBU2184296.1 energy transducer TonB [Gammaproteobacteria bacterium]MBU2206447.1 energy transducer TonB [Gammaproteobacteria bacterium]